MIIAAIDPGGTTGWATHSVETIEVPLEHFQPVGSEWHNEYCNEQWLCGQFGPDEHHNELYQWLETLHTQDFIIVCERFDFRGDDRSDINLMAREYIGVVKLFAQERSVDVVWQWPFEGVGTRSFIQPSNLKTLGVWVKGGGSEWVHAMDAYRHLLYYMTAKPNVVVDRAQRADLLRRMGK